MPALPSRSRSGASPHPAAAARTRVRPADNDSVGAPVSEVTSFFHEDGHPWLHQTVRDIAGRGEGTLTAIVRETNAGRTVRVAHIRSASGIEWTTAADNIQLVS